MDLHSRVTFDNKSEVTRYGGSIPEPTMIAPDLTIEIALNDDTTLTRKTITSTTGRFANFDKVRVYDSTTVKQRAYEIRQNPNDIHLYTGYQYDPFIFPRLIKGAKIRFWSTGSSFKAVGALWISAVTFRGNSTCGSYQVSRVES